MNRYALSIDQWKIQCEVSTRRTLDNTLHLMTASPYSDNASRPAAEAQVMIRQVQTFGKTEGFGSIKGEILFCTQSDLGGWQKENEIYHRINNLTEYVT